MVGYHRRPEENEKALTPDGGLRTGDLGRLDEDGFLFITGRIKDQYKLENGKYVVPSPLEEALELSPYLAKVMIYGDGRPYNVALVALDVAAIRKWGKEHGVPIDGNLANDPKVRELVAREIDLYAESFKGFEKPRGFTIVTDEFSTASGLLTPTLKIKRNEVLKRYKPILDALYA
jgi:long-chain acyl-CoA synthetase